LNQEQVAERAGISQEHYCKVENGKGLPSLRALARIAAALGLESAAPLIPGRGGEGNPPLAPVKPGENEAIPA